MTDSSEPPIFCDSGDHCELNLKNDLYDLYRKIKKGTLVFGNGGNDEYVFEVLEQLEKQYEIKIEKRGSFWFFRR